MFKSFLKWVPFFAVSLIVLFLTALSSQVEIKQAEPIKDLPIFKRALYFTKQNYVEPGQVDTTKILRSSLREVAKSVDPLVFTLSQNQLDLSMGEAQKKLLLPENCNIQQLSSLLTNSLNFVSDHYKGTSDLEKWEHLTIQGALATLDTHSSFLPPRIFTEFKIGTKGNFGGLGIVVGVRDGELTVITPLEDTPAWAADLKPNDRIVEIDGESTINMPLSEAVEKLRGPVGTTVTIIIHREGRDKDAPIKLQRDLIRIKSVNASLIDKENRIGLLKIKNFQEDTTAEMDRYLSLLKQEAGPEGLSGLILDLRNNPGGLLDQAISVTDRFLDRGIIVTTVGAKGDEEERDFARPGSPEENLPLVVLVNEGSASASEIVSGALKNLNRAVILGEQTFGKGSVQTIYDLQDDSGLKLTIAKYLAAGRIPVQTVGVMPDIFLQPVTLSKKRINLIKDEVPREDSLSKKTTPYAVDSKPVFTLRYLGEEDPDEPNIDLEAQKEAKISLEQDLPVRLAKGILIQSRSLSRQQEIKKSLPFLETVRSEEEKKIAAAISRIGIDWTTGMNSQKPAAVISLEILNEKGEKRQELIPGKESTLQLTVENKGRAPFTQLHGVMQSEDAFFKNHEFIFGRIEPKQKKSWVLPLKVPDFMIPRDVPVTIHFEEGNKNNPDPFKTNFKIAVLPSPLYGFTFKGHDNGSFSSKGNGDGKLQKGESISLQISLKNHGPRISEQPLVNLINPDKAPIFIEKGRVELSPLAPGETANTTLVFHLDPAQTPDEFQLELEIADGKIGNRFSKKLKFKMNGELPETKENAEAVPPSIFIDKIPLSSKFPQEILNGYVTDNRKPKSLMIFVDEEKVYYAESQEGVPFKFHKNILLKKGSNLITLMAEDNEGLKSQRQWFLWRQ